MLQISNIVNPKGMDLVSFSKKLYLSSDFAG